MSNKKKLCLFNSNPLVFYHNHKKFLLLLLYHHCGTCISPIQQLINISFLDNLEVPIVFIFIVDQSLSSYHR